MIKAIETHYAGCRFRSRLEARWAIFFDTLGIEWQYEPEGFELPSGRYLPDFFLPNIGTCGQWGEVKGRTPTEHEGQLMTELQQGTGSGMFLSGDIPKKPTLHLMLVFGRDIQLALTAARSARFEHGENG